MATKVFSVLVVNCFGIKGIVGVFDDEKVVKEMCDTFEPSSLGYNERMIYIESEMNKPLSI